MATKNNRIRRLLLGLGAVILVGLAVAAFLFWRSTIPTAPSDFYTPPDPLPAGEPGMIIRSEELTQNVPEGARAWRVLYLSRGADGQPAAVSGIIAAPTAASEEPRPIVAWAHGTLGIQPACGTGHLDNPFEQIPQVARLMEQGYVLAATDYPGLGTPGVHPYLFGDVEAAAVLDSVRAARQLDTGAGDRFAVWGHSQGGHATLWTAITAKPMRPNWSWSARPPLRPRPIWSASSPRRWTSGPEPSSSPWPSLPGTPTTPAHRWNSSSPPTRWPR